MKKILSVLCVGILSVGIFGGCKSNNNSLNKILKLESELASTKEELMNSNAQINKLNNELAITKEELIKSNGKINKLNSEIDNANKEIKELQTIIADPSKIFIGRMDLDTKTESFLYGTWKVEKLLGFSISYNDASEYPSGQKIIGDEIIIKKDLFSSKGLENYNTYQYKFINPLYKIKGIYLNENSFCTRYKVAILNLNRNDNVKYIGVSSSHTKKSASMSFFVVNNNRLILLLEATWFELKKID